jgi:hypothetical protein
VSVKVKYLFPRKVIAQPDPQSLGATLYEEEARRDGYVVYARNVPPPFDDLEPGALVIGEYDGMGSRWINGTIYVRKDVLEKKQNQSP